MSVILPLATVTLSCTLPYCVPTASPVTVLDDEDEDEDDEDDEDDEGAGAEAAATVAASAADSAWCGWNPRVAARPRAVAVRTIGARYMTSTIAARAVQHRGIPWEPPGDPDRCQAPGDPD